MMWFARARARSVILIRRVINAKVNRALSAEPIVLSIASVEIASLDPPDLSPNRDRASRFRDSPVLRSN